MKDLRLNNNHIKNRTQSGVNSVKFIGKYINNVRKRTQVAEASQTIDFRKQIQFNYDEVSSDEFDDVIENMYEITANLNGKEIGYMNFVVTYGKEDESLNEMLIKMVEVNDDMQGLGIGQLLYKKFGEIYVQDFNNIPVARYFINPIAEYSFRKAVSLGWIPNSVVDESKIKRNYTEEGKQLWDELQQKLPEQYRGALKNV